MTTQDDMASDLMQRLPTEASNGYVSHQLAQDEQVQRIYNSCVEQHVGCDQLHTVVHQTLAHLGILSDARASAAYDAAQTAFYNGNKSGVADAAIDSTSHVGSAILHFIGTCLYNVTLGYINWVLHLFDTGHGGLGIVFGLLPFVLIKMIPSMIKFIARGWAMSKVSGQEHSLSGYVAMNEVAKIFGRDKETKE